MALPCLAKRAFKIAFHWSVTLQFKTAFASLTVDLIDASLKNQSVHVSSQVKQLFGPVSFPLAFYQRSFHIDFKVKH